MQNPKLSYKRSTVYFYVLFLAGIYNIAWGSWVILFPELSFTLHGMEIPRYLEIWQCVGMIVGVYGLGYIAASSDPVKHWPIVLVGFLGKIFGPIGFAKALVDGVFPVSFLINIIFNDLIWWIPFFLILRDAYKIHTFELPSDADLNDLCVAEQTVVLALRHQGCTFTRMNLERLAHYKTKLQESGYGLCVVHMGTNNEIDGLMKEYLGDLNYKLIEDPSRRYYQALGLRRASLLQAFGLKEFIYGFKAFLKGHGLGPLRGDGFQLGGVFRVYKGEVEVSSPTFRASDEFDFDSIFEG